MLDTEFSPGRESIKNVLEFEIIIDRVDFKENLHVVCIIEKSAMLEEGASTVNKQRE